MPQEKKLLTLSQIVNLNLGTLGILFAWELEIANVSGIYTFLGAKASNLGYLWLPLSIIGLIIPLIIGYLSDHTYTAYGKRLPYILGGAALTAICLFLLPNSASLTDAVILLCIFTAGINAALQPFKSLVADIVVEQEHTRAYAIQAAFIGIGATLASISPWLLLILFGQHSEKDNMPFEIRFAFYIGAITILLTCLWTTIKTKAYLPKLIKPQPNLNKIKRQTIADHIKQFCALFSTIPKIMWQVSLVQFFTWMGAFCFIIYLTPAIEQAIFNIPIGIQHIPQIHLKSFLEKSIVLNGICCAIYMAVNIIYAYIIPFLAKAITRKSVHILSLAIGGLSLLAFIFVHSLSTLFITMIGVGIAWASFNSLPFAMIAGSIPNEKLGIYMGFFNMAICLPQIIVSLGVGFILKSFLSNDAISLILLSGISLLIAAVIMLFVKDKPINEIT